ncbi:hypothetical protein FACS1894214_2990 [Planctomycetales bacterium]|nr:hypothetical protein FACS1894214_2990 [Planctomycetales bacterium]
MSTASGQEEPITYDSILRLIKQHTLELQQSSVEFDRRIAEERKLREESFAAERSAQ